MPPANSTYTKQLSYDIFELIEKDLLYYKGKGDVLMCGDFNARTATELDVIINDSSKYIPLFNSYKIDNTTRVRRSHDTVLDTRGKELLEFCIENQLRIMNGRCLGDIFGHFTCFNPLGQSTVDYLLASEKITNQILYFKVSDFIPILSDCHCKISWEILAKFQHLQSSISEESLHKVPINYIWTEDSDLRFREALNSPNIQTKINNFLKTSAMCTHDTVPDVISEFENIILSAAELSLKKPNFKNKNKKNKHRKWFDADLGKLRAQVFAHGKLYGKFPKDPIIKGHYYKLYREYNKLRRMKCRKFKNDIIEKLDSLRIDDPKQYWKLVNDLRAEKADSTIYSVEPNKWLNHFKSLHTTVAKNFENRFQELDSLLSEKNIFTIYSMN